MNECFLTLRETRQKKNQSEKTPSDKKNSLTRTGTGRYPHPHGRVGTIIVALHNYTGSKNPQGGGTVNILRA